MSDDANEPPEWTGYDRLGQLRYSIRNLMDEFGSTDRPLHGLVINSALALTGALVVWQFSGWIAMLGAVWMFINLFGIIQWAVGL